MWPHSRKIKVLVLLLGIVIILSLSLDQNEVKNSFYLISESLQKSLWQKGDSFSDFWEGIIKGRDFKKENEELEKRYQELLQEVVSLRVLKKENRMLREALEIGLQEEFKLVLAELVSRDVSEDAILIDKGSGDGLSAGMPVITEDKVLLGKVSEVYEDFSRVVLISHPESSFPAEVEEEITGVIKGKGSFQIFLEMVPRDKEIEEGRVVMTSSLGEIFPKGLLIGEVKKIEKSDIKPFQEVKISPFFDIEELKAVFIITSF